MYSYPLAGLLVLACLAPRAPVPQAKEDAKTALEALQGEWCPFGIVMADTVYRQETIDLQGRVVIKGARATILVRGDGDPEVKLAEVTIKLAPGRRPKEIDLTLEHLHPDTGCCGTQPMPKGTTLKGLYSLDGDILKVYLGYGEDRPKHFPPAGEEFGMLVLRRLKARG